MKSAEQPSSSIPTHHVAPTPLHSDRIPHPSLGEQAVRLARLAAVMHMDQAARLRAYAAEARLHEQDTPAIAPAAFHCGGDA